MILPHQLVQAFATIMALMMILVKMLTVTVLLMTRFIVHDACKLISHACMVVSNVTVETTSMFYHLLTKQCKVAT